MEINHATNKIYTPQDTIIMWIHKLENDNEEIAYSVVHADRDKKMKPVKRQAHTQRKTWSNYSFSIRSYKK